MKMHCDRVFRDCFTRGWVDGTEFATRARNLIDCDEDVLSTILCACLQLPLKLNIIGKKL